MTHEYEGRYRTKHAPNAGVDSKIGELIHEKARNRRLSCASAFTIARETGTSPAKIGESADLLEVKITACQLGLFGYQKGSRNIVEPAESVPAELAEALKARRVKGRLPCIEAWAVAEQFGLSKMEITAACETLGIRLSQCQLGTF